MQNDLYPQPSDNSSEPQPVRPVSNVQMPTPQAPDQLGVSVFPSHVEDNSQPVPQYVQPPDLPQSPQPMSQNTQVPQSSQPMYSQQSGQVTPSQDYGVLASQTPVPNLQPQVTTMQTPVASPSPQPTVVSETSSGTSVKPIKPKSFKNWVILVVFIALVAAIFGYFYLTTEQALNGAKAAADSYEPSAKRPYAGAMIASGRKAYQVYIPNGSDIVIDSQGDMIVFHELGLGDDKPIKQGYLDGVGGGDRPKLSIWTQKKSSTAAIDGAKPTNPFYVDGVQAKYYHRAYQPDEPIGSVKAEGGEKVYRYVFDYDGKQTIVDYFIKRKDDDLSEQVAKMVASLKFKRAQARTSTDSSN